MSQTKIKHKGPRSAGDHPDPFKGAGAKPTVDLRRAEARQSDVKRLIRARKLPLMGFKWAERYNPIYAGEYARKKGWNQGRLNKAIETLDLEYRLYVNYLRSKKQGITRKQAIKAKRALRATQKASASRPVPRQ